MVLFLEQKIINAGKAAFIASPSKQRELSCGRFPWSSWINGSLFPEGTWLTEQKSPGSNWCFATSCPPAKPLILLIHTYLSLYPGNKQQITPEQSNDSMGRAHRAPWALQFVCPVPGRQSWILPSLKKAKRAQGGEGAALLVTMRKELSKHLLLSSCLPPQPFSDPEWSWNQSLGWGMELQGHSGLGCHWHP